MTFKQNIPLIALGFVALAGAALVVLLQPSDEDRLDRAVREHVATLGAVQEHRRSGAVADVLLADGRVLYLEFEKKDGQWKPARDLGKEFDGAMKDPENGRQFTERLGKRLADRYQMPVTVKPGIEYGYRVGRDDEGKLVGCCEAKFAFPKVGERQPRGRYAENYRWTEGKWTSEGPGRLFEEPPRR